MIHHLEFYTIEELQQIIMHSARILDVGIEPLGAKEMAKRSRGTPRLANRILKRVRDFAQVKYDGIITEEVARDALDLMDVDKLGLDHIDRNMLLTMIQKFGGGPVGLDTLAAAIGEDSGTIEDVYEPYLIKNGLLTERPEEGLQRIWHTAIWDWSLKAPASDTGLLFTDIFLQNLKELVLPVPMI